MRKPMDFEAFADLLEFIDEEHRFGVGGKHIKYIVPTIDTRTADIHAIDFYGLEDKSFRIVNEDADKDLEKMITNWLNRKEETK